MLAFVISLALIVLLLLAEMPIAFAFGIGALVFGVWSGSDVSFLIPYAYQTTSSFALLALPLFVMAGTLMAQGGISDRLLAFVNAFIGRLKGGLGAVTVVTCALFGAISGSSSAAIAAIGPDHDPAHDQGRIPGRPRHRAGRLFVGPRADDPALDPDDRLRGDRGDLRRCGVPVGPLSRAPS